MPPTRSTPLSLPPHRPRLWRPPPPAPSPPSSELAALHRRASSSSSTSPPLSLPSVTFLSSTSTAASLIPRLTAARVPASLLLPPLAASLSAHPLPAAVAYLRLLLAPNYPLLTLFSPLPFLSLLAIRKAASAPAGDTANPNPGLGASYPRKRKNKQRGQQSAVRAEPSLLPQALSLLTATAGRLPLEAHLDARRSLVDTAMELAAFDVLAAILESDYCVDAVQDLIRALAPVVLSGMKSQAHVFPSHISNFGTLPRSPISPPWTPPTTWTPLSPPLRQPRLRRPPPPALRARRPPLLGLLFFHHLPAIVPSLRNIPLLRLPHPRLAAAGVPASSLLPSLAASLSAHPLLAVVAYLCLLLAPDSPLLILFSSLPFLSRLLTIRKSVSAPAGGTANINPGSGASKPLKRKNKQRG